MINSARQGPDRRPLRIAVFRALNLGDLLCFVPALRALRASYPRAFITLIGLDSARPLVQRFPHYIDELVLFPGDEHFPEQPVRDQELPAFYEAMQARQFDLALQMHGTGQHSNAIVQRLGAARWVGFVPRPGQARPGCLLAWPAHLPEARRYLALLQHAGMGAAARDDGRLELPLSGADLNEASEHAAVCGLVLERTVVLHPGARLPSRRWPVSRFADVGRVLCDAGWQIAVTGSRAERALVDAVCGQLQRPAANLCGQTSLGGMAALLSRVPLLICNDTGVSHIAAAVRTPSVVVACGSEVARWAPLDRERHVVLHADPGCRPCAWHDCPYPGHPCARAVSVDDVLQVAQRKLAAGSQRWRPAARVRDAAARAVIPQGLPPWQPADR